MLESQGPGSFGLRCVSPEDGTKLIQPKGYYLYTLREGKM